MTLWDTVVTEKQKNSFDAYLSVEPSGCWIWTGHLTPAGYGWFSVGTRKGGVRKAAMTHRLSYERHRGPIPHGMVLDHLCRNRSCANPDHLEPVTMKENLLRGNGFSGVNSRKTHCSRGHSYEEHGKRTNGGWRRCTLCEKIHEAGRRGKRKKQLRQSTPVTVSA